MTKEKIEELTIKLEQHYANMSDEEKEAEWEELTHEKFYTRWTDKFHALTKEQRAEIIEKIINKYYSREYRDREIKMGYEPRETLFAMLVEYGKRYGETCPDNLENEFLENAYIIDDTYLISVIFGQGCMYQCFKLTHEQYDMYMQNITEGVLLKNGFVKCDTHKFEPKEYKKHIDGYTITVRHISNMIERDWLVHIDNYYYDSIARVDIQTIEHFNKVMELMEINYSLQ